MIRLWLIVFFITLMKAEGRNNSTACNGFQANFTMKSVIGPWFVVAIIPEKLFPEKQEVTCYKVEFSETDEAGLRWLVNNTLESQLTADVVEDIKGTIIRQRYHSEHPFDVWSKSIEGVNGCFQQVLSLDINKSDINEANTHEAMMQLHILDPNDGSGPFLLQMLWGRMISVVVYRHYMGVTQDQLKPVYELMSKMRGPQRIPRICKRPEKDTLFTNKITI